MLKCPSILPEQSSAHNTDVRLIKSMDQCTDKGRIELSIRVHQHDDLSCAPRHGEVRTSCEAEVLSRLDDESTRRERACDCATCAIAVVDDDDLQLSGRIILRQDRMERR